MGFFTDLKEDLNQAVAELLPEEPEARQETANGQSGVDEVQGDIALAQQQMANLEEMLQNIDELRITENEEEGGAGPVDVGMPGISVEVTKEEEPEPGAEANLQEGWEEEELELPQETDGSEEGTEDSEPVPVLPEVGNLEKELRAAFGVSGNEETMEEYLYRQAMRAGSEVIDKSWIQDLKDTPVTDENAVITAGMKVKGDIISSGNLEVTGEVTGNVQVCGKLSVTGRITGNSKANEIYANSARITGDLIGDGAVKIGEGSVVRGNLEATSAVIAGAVKGTIDVKGPVVLDATAVVFGNIRAKSMQINNGARIEGMCVLCYAGQSASKFFEAEENM